MHFIQSLTLLPVILSGLSHSLWARDPLAASYLFFPQAAPMEQWVLTWLLRPCCVKSLATTSSRASKPNARPLGWISPLHLKQGSEQRHPAEPTPSTSPCPSPSLITTRDTEAIVWRPPWGGASECGAFQCVTNGCCCLFTIRYQSNSSVCVCVCQYEHSKVVVPGNAATHTGGHERALPAHHFQHRQTHWWEIETWDS